MLTSFTSEDVCNQMNCEQASKLKDATAMQFSTVEDPARCDLTKEYAARSRLFCGPLIRPENSCFDHNG